MFLTTHSSIGIAIATKVVNPWLAFIMAFIIHYLFDAIPHGDESIFDTKTKKHRYKNIVKSLIIDLIIVSVYILFIMTKIPLNPIIIFAAVLGSILPDVLWGLYDITQIKILSPFAKLHSFFHNPLHKNMRLAAGIVLQFILIIIATLYILQ
jgi:hypothetical protein